MGPSKAEETEVGPSRAEEIIAERLAEMEQRAAERESERERRAEERENQMAERAAECARRLQEEDDDDDDTITIHIDENGSRYEATNGVETYVQFPFVPPEVSEYSVVAYNVNDTHTSPPDYMGGPLTWDRENDTCPDGTYDCLYHENVVNGRVVGITDADGNSLVRQFTDDLYNGRLTLYDDDFYQTLNSVYKIDDNGRLMMKAREGLDEDLLIQPGFNMPISMFIFIIVLLNKYNGKPKPKFIIDFPSRTMAEMREEFLKMLSKK